MKRDFVKVGAEIEKINPEGSYCEPYRKMKVTIYDLLTDETSEKIKRLLIRLRVPFVKDDDTIFDEYRVLYMPQGKVNAFIMETNKMLGEEAFKYAEL